MILACKVNMVKLPRGSEVHALQVSIIVSISLAHSTSDTACSSTSPHFDSLSFLTYVGLQIGLGEALNK